MQKNSETGNRTPVSRVTGGDTSHYTISDALLTEVVLTISIVYFSPESEIIHQPLKTKYSTSYQNQVELSDFDNATMTLRDQAA